MTTSATANGRDRATTSSFLRRVRIRNYKSIAHCDVELGQLTILVGRNGSGKSNFLDALRFVQDVLWLPFSRAITSRDGPFGIPRKAAGVESVVVELELDLGDGGQARYEIEMVMRPATSPWHWEERLTIKGPDDVVVHDYEVVDGKLTHSTIGTMPPVAHDRLYLINASGLPEFRPVYDALSRMAFYHIRPERMREVQSPRSIETILHPDGGNIASVIRRFQSDPPPVDNERLLGYLKSIVPEIAAVNHVGFLDGQFETLEFEQTSSASGSSRTFHAKSMSDGTLHALGTLVAVAQLAMQPPSVRLVGLEKPETFLHPAAAAALMDALQEAAVAGQVIVTTHSPDLIDRVDFDSVRLLIVQMRAGVTEIGSVDSASRQIIKEHLFTPGDLLRMDQLEPDWNDIERQQQMKSFDLAERSG